MTEFIASNDKTVATRDDGTIYVDGMFLTPGERVAVQEFFQHEERLAREPWRRAQPQEVWQFTTDHRINRALGWVAWDGTWDVLDHKGNHLGPVADPIAALVDAGFADYATATAVHLIPEVQS